MPRASNTIKDNPPITDNSNKTKAELRQEALNGVLQVGQLAALTFGQFSDAGAIGMHGPKLVSETVALAESNSKVASKVDLLIEIGPYAGIDRKSTRLNSSHLVISYAVFCLKKKKKSQQHCFVCLHEQLRLERVRD